MRTRLEATDIVITLSTRPAGASIWQQRVEFVLSISDAIELKLQIWTIWLTAFILALDDCFGLAYHQIRNHFTGYRIILDNFRLLFFVTFTGMRLCVVN